MKILLITILLIIPLITLAADDFLALRSQYEKAQANLKQQYITALKQLAEKKEKESDLKTLKSIQKELKLFSADITVSETNATLFYMVDDAAILYLNNKIVSQYSGWVGIVRLLLKPGDVLTIRCVNNEGGTKDQWKGFACVIKYDNGTISNTLDWKSYKPKDVNKWYERDTITSVYPVNKIEAHPWAADFFKKVEEECIMVWGDYKPICYFCYEVK